MVERTNPNYARTPFFYVKIRNRKISLTVLKFFWRINFELQSTLNLSSC